MADSPQTPSISLNSFALHLQKLELELKCTVCVKLYTEPRLLPCDHIFCRLCVSKSASHIFEYECPQCRLPLVEQELKRLPHMENLVNIYRSFNDSFSSHMSKSGTSANGTVYSSQPENSNTQLSNVSTMRTQRASELNNSAATIKMGNVCGFADSSLRNGSMEQGFQTLESNKSFSKGVETEGCRARNSDKNTEHCSGEKSAKRKVDGLGAEGLDDCLGRQLKKGKQINQGLSDMNMGPSLSSSMQVQNSTSSGSGTNAKPGIISADQLVQPACTSLVNFICAFCQTWKIKEGSGPMQHYANGKEVSESEARHSNVVHVHKSCFEWAPLIYFDGDNVIKNLDEEIARAAKLKCHKCGLKGAALGCYVASCRRSYHAPCAYEDVDCRWDTDDFLMLCSYHTKHKFPREKSKKAAVKKCTSSATTTICDKSSSHESAFWATSPAGVRKWVLCGSALSAEEKCNYAQIMLVEFAKICGATVTKDWNPNVTHVIAATDANGACSRTFKVLMAILKGIWVLKTDWVKECMESKCPVDEEPYEISLDIHGSCNGPKTGRLRALRNEPQLFNGISFFFTGDFMPRHISYIQDLIIAGGGTIIATREELKRISGGQSGSSSVLVVYNHESTTGSQDVSELVLRRVEAEKLVLESGSQAVPPTWIVDSVASGALQPFALR